MKISKIEIKNFKNFEDVSVDLNKFNVITGRRASGKSNFIKVFRFLKDICDSFEKAVRNYGFIKNTDQSTYIKVTLECEKSILNEFKCTSVEYELMFDDIEFIEEKVMLNFSDENSLIILNNGKITVKFLKEDENIKKLIPEILLDNVNNDFKENDLIVNTQLSSIPFLWSEYFKSIGYYNFDSKTSRTTHRIEIPELGECGQICPLFWKKY